MRSISDPAKAPSLGPGIRIAGATILSAVIACLTGTIPCLAGLAAGLIVIAAAWHGTTILLRRLAAVNIFIAFMWLLVPWSTPGPAIWNFGPLAISSTGIALCLAITLKANAIMLIFTGLLARLSLSQLAGGLASLHFPDKLAWLLLLMERNVHLLGREWRTLTEAASLRGFSARTGRHGYTTLAAMLAILFVKAQERSQKLQEALLLAGFNGSLPFRAPLRPGLAAISFLLLVTAASIALLCLNHACPAA